MTVLTTSQVPKHLKLNESFTLLVDLYEANGNTLVTSAPDTLEAELIDPAGASTVYTLGVDTEWQSVTLPAQYRFSTVLASEGQWDWKIKAEWTVNPALAGNVVAEGLIHVQSNRAKMI